MNNTFEEFSKINLQRATRWHKTGLDEWSVVDWSNAFAGEAGEVCNAVKKLRRLQCKIAAGDGDTPQPKDLSSAVIAVGKEIGDAFTYLDLLAQRLGLSLFDCAKYAFNKISEREGLPERFYDDSPQ